MRNVALFLCLIFWLPAAVPAQEPEPAPPRPKPYFRMIGPDTYQIGTVRLEAAARTIRCAGHVNMAEGGPIELLACLPWGKTHESVLTLDIVPTDLQAALLLLGLTPGRNPAVRYKPDSIAARTLPGDLLVLSVQWALPVAEGEEPKLKTVRAESLLMNVQTHKPVPEARWVFLGSRLTDGRFGADMGGSIVTTYHDPMAIIELADETANDDIYYDVNAALCPPAGTAVTLVIHAPLPEPEPGQAPEGDAAEPVPPSPPTETRDAQGDRRDGAA